MQIAAQTAGIIAMFMSIISFNGSNPYLRKKRDVQRTPAKVGFELRSLKTCHRHVFPVYMLRI